MGKRDLMLSEAIRLFNRQGYFDTRLEDIAENIGVGKTSISYHFKNKQTLLAEAYSQAIQSFENQISEASECETGLGKVLHFMELHQKSHARAIKMEISPIALMSDFGGLHEPDASDLSNRYKSLVRSVFDMLKLGRKDGSIHVQSLEATTFLIFNVMHWVPKWLEIIPERLHADASQGLLDLISNGLKADHSLKIDASFRRGSIPVQPAIFDRDARNAMKMDAILRTGIRHLNKNGYRNLSLDDISAELGVTRGALYYQIPDKESFLSASFERTFDIIENALEGVTSDQDKPAIMSLEYVITTIFDAHISELDPLLRLNLMPMLTPGAKRVMESRLRRLLAQFSELIGRGQLDGSIRAFECEGSEYLLLGALFAASSKRLAATKLSVDWQPGAEPVFDASNYFEAIFLGMAKN